MAHRSARLFGSLGVWIALCGACGADERPRRDRDGIALPVVRAKVADLAPGKGVIKVTRDGRVLVGGEPKSINELLAILAKEPDTGPIELRADRDALWMHVQWVMAALGQAGHKNVQCIVEVAGCRRQGAMELPVTRGLLEDRLGGGYLDPYASDDPPVWLGRVTVRLSGGGRAKRRAYHLEAGLDVTVARFPYVVGRWAASLIERAGASRWGFGFVVEAMGTVPYRHVIAALAALQKAGARRFEVGLEALHPWDRDLAVLPRPPHEDPVGFWFLMDYPLRPLVPMNLPVASMCEQDRDDDPDDRVIVNLTATGHLLVREKELTLSALATLLMERARWYDLKMRARGKEGHEDAADGSRWSKLYVLLRADQDTPWQHVRWVLAELSESRFYKLQLAARKTVGRNLTQAEAERRWAGREIYYPPSALAGKLYCFLSTRSSEPEENYLDVRLTGSPARYHCGGRETRSAEVLYQWIREAYRLRGERRTIGRIVAGPRTPMGEVVVAVNCFARAGMELVDFAEISRAPDAVRQVMRLPRPQ